MTDVDEPEWVAAERREALEHLARTAPADRPPEPAIVVAHELDEFLDAPEPSYDWIVSGLLERGDRVMVTGPEGGGKSTLLSQIAVQLAAGMHPFTLEQIDPLSVLLLDAENSRRQVRRRLRPLRDHAGDAYDSKRLHVVVTGGSLHLAERTVEEALAELVRRHEIDVLVIGPLYKLNRGDPLKEETARDLADTLDRLRAIRGSGLLVEAHVPYAENSRTKRLRRPYGASLWSRWPEYGVYLDPESGALDHWRGQRDERAWPTRLVRSTPWPWAPAPDQPAESTWDGPTECMAAVTEYFRQHANGEELSRRKVIERLRALGLSYRDRTIGDALERLVADGVLLARDGPRRSRLYRLAEGDHTDELF